MKRGVFVADELHNVIADDVGFVNIAFGGIECPMRTFNYVIEC